MTTRDDDFDRGLVNRRAVLGDEWVDQSLNQTRSLESTHTA